MGTVATILEILAVIREIAPIAIQGFDDAKKFVVPLYRSLTGGAEMTPEEEAEIDAGIQAMSEELQSMKRPE